MAFTELDCDARVPHEAYVLGIGDYRSRLISLARLDFKVNSHATFLISRNLSVIYICFDTEEFHIFWVKSSHFCLPLVSRESWQVVPLEVYGAQKVDQDGDTIMRDV